MEEARQTVERSGAATEAAVEPHRSSVPQGHFLPTRRGYDEGKEVWSLTDSSNAHCSRNRAKQKTRQNFQQTKPLNSNICLKNTCFTEIALRVFHSIISPPKVSIS